MRAPYVGLKEHSKNVLKIKSQIFIFRVDILGFSSFASSLKKFKVRKAERLKIRSNNSLSLLVIMRVHLYHWVIYSAVQ